MPEGRPSKASRSRLAGVACVLLACAGLGGCATLVALLPPAFEPCREPSPAAPSRLGDDFRWRSHASLRVDAEERAALEIVVEKRGDRLVLVAFDRTGLKLLSAVQEGAILHSEPATGRPRAVAAETLLADLRRIREPGSVEPDLVVVSDVTGSGEHRVTLRDPRCGTEAVYVTVEESPLR